VIFADSVAQHLIVEDGTPWWNPDQLSERYWL